VKVKMKVQLRVRLRVRVRVRVRVPLRVRLQPQAILGPPGLRVVSPEAGSARPCP
jgi:hypothetical protein